MIQQVVIHKRLVDAFKRRALAVMPHEHIVAVMGRQQGETLYVHAFDVVDVFNKVSNDKEIAISYYQPEEEIEAGTTLKYFGTLHSHPNRALRPSKTDIKDFLEGHNSDFYPCGTWHGETLRDEIMGIMRVNKNKKVNQWGLVFYNIDLSPLELLIAENKRGQKSND